MTTVQQVILWMSDEMHLWRDSAVCVLALIVIGCLYLYAEVYVE